MKCNIFSIRVSQLKSSKLKLTWQVDIYLLAQKWRALLKKTRLKQLQPNEYSSGVERVFWCFDNWYSLTLCLHADLLMYRDIFAVQSGYVWGG
jgi:hypothetical protein